MPAAVDSRAISRPIRQNVFAPPHGTFEQGLDELECRVSEEGDFSNIVHPNNMIMAGMRIAAANELRGSNCLHWRLSFTQLPYGCLCGPD